MRQFLISLSLIALATAGQASDIRFGSNWKEQRFSLFSSNDYGFRGNALSVISDGSVSLAYTELDEADWGATSARWTWAVEESVPATDLARKGGDDRNLALYTIFLPAEAAQRLKGQSVRSLLGSDEVRVLIYVWGGNAARGAVLDSPYLGARGKTVVLRPAGTGQFTETIDFARDYARAFGGRPEAIVGLAVSADSDDTDTKIRAAISGLRVE